MVPFRTIDGIERKERRGQQYSECSGIPCDCRHWVISKPGMELLNASQLDLLFGSLIKLPLRPDMRGREYWCPWRVEISRFRRCELISYGR